MNLFKGRFNPLGKANPNAGTTTNGVNFSLHPPTLKTLSRLGSAAFDEKVNGFFMEAVQNQVI